MSEQNDYILILNNLPNGKHNFEYRLVSDFFAQFDEKEVADGDVEVKIVAEKCLSSINLTFDLKGTIKVACNRCLDEMTLPIETQENILVKIGNFSDNNGEFVVLNEHNPEFDITWLLYELIVTSIPIWHSHEEGKCNEEMMKQINRYLIKETDI